MSGISAEVEIPSRTLFKAAEVCEILQVQPYVLRSWEAEFPELGVARTAGGPRVYRRADVEQVARIKRLLLVDGLTLAGARRKLEKEMTPVGADQPAIDELIGQNARERLTDVKRGLRSILELLARLDAGESVPASAVLRVRAVKAASPTVTHATASRGRAPALRKGRARTEARRSRRR